MNETKKSLTLDEAKAEIAELKRLNSGHCYVNDCLKQAESILARVEQPSEEDMAVLWLMKEKGWVFRYRQRRCCWEQQLDPQFDDWVECRPAEEARKLGWRG